MAKKEVNNNDALSDILAGSVGEMAQSLVGDMLSAVEAASGCLIYLHPDKWGVNFLGIKGGDASLAADAPDERIWSTLRELYACKGGSDLRPEQTHRLIFELIFELAARLQLTLPQLRWAAMRLLTSKGLPLGGDALTPDGRRQVEHWSVAGGGRNMLRFQDALDWRATFDRDLDRMKRQRADIASYEALGGERPTVLKVPRSAAREGLVTADTLDVFVAEHIIALDEQTFSQPGLILDAPEPYLTFFFLPIRGVGQWRAAIDWIIVEPSAGYASLVKQLGEQASNLSHSALEELMTTSLLDIFAKAVRKSLPPYTVRHNRKREALRDAFTILFCAREVLYYKRGKCVERLIRDNESGKLVPVEAAARCRDLYHPELWATVAGSRFPGFFSHDERRHPDLTHIRLLITPVMNAAVPRDEAAARLEEMLPFDEVHYRLHLFQADESEIRRWGDQLAECLEQIVVEQYLRQVAYESERERVYARVYEHVAHFLAASLNVAGLDDTRKTLRRELRGMLAESVPLRKVNNALTLLTVMEGSVGLLRLIGILSRKEFGKLSEWFDEESLRLWYSDDPADQKRVLDLYADSVVHLVRAAGSARGRPWCEAVVNGQSVPRDDSYCEFERGRLQFPPLSLAKRGEAVYALLPALVEPLVNALLFYADAGGQIPAREPIKVVIDDRRQNPPQGTSPHISVKVGNLCPPALFPTEADMRHDPPGVQMTRRLMKLSRLATLMPTEHDGTHRWVTVLLHPQKLHAWIHMHERPSARRVL